MSGAQVHLHGRGEGDDRQPSEPAHDLGGAGVALDVPVVLLRPLRIARIWPAVAATHHDDRHGVEHPRPSDLEQTEVREGSDRDHGRAAVDALLHQIERGARRRRHRLDRVTPVARVVGEAPGLPQRRHRVLGAGGDRDAGAPREVQHLEREPGAATTFFMSRCDAGDLDVRPAQQHRERAHIVGITTDVGVEMHQHGASVSVACRAVLAISLPDWLDQPTLRNVALGTMAGLALLAFLVAWLVRKVVMKLILVVLLVGAGFAIYNQREELATCAKDCDCKFFGMEVTLPEGAADACAIVNHQ